MDGNSALWERRPWAHVTAVLAAVMVVTTVFLPSWSAALGMVALFYVLLPFGWFFHSAFMFQVTE